VSNSPVADLPLKWSSVVSGGLATDGDMSQTSITSTPTNVEGIKTLSYQLTWAATGSPIGTLSFEGSNNYSSTAGTGTWVAFSSSLIVGLSSVHPAGSAGDHLVTIDTGVCKARHIRVKYTRTSGSGTLTGWVFGS
jgi:hypothetical protein